MKKNRASEEPTVLWHTLSVQETLDALHSTKLGLSTVQAKKRLARYGWNELEEKSKASVLYLFFTQFKSVLILILLAGVGFSVYAGHTVEAGVISVVIFLSVILGFIQEYRAERAMESLQKMAPSLASVLRDGQFRDIPTHDIVPGDIVKISVGNRIPADIRVIEAINLQVNEAPLTGESVPIEKTSAPFVETRLSIGDRRNLLYAGTSVTYGRGIGVVITTGMATEFGHIVALLQKASSHDTPLQKTLDHIGNVLAVVALVIVLAIVGVGILRGEALHEMILFGIALAVAVVPEALPAVVTISLAIGARRMACRNALIRRLPAVETLGSTSVICSDKTGTLTRDEMTVRKIWVANEMFTVTGVGYEPVGRIVKAGTQVRIDPPLSALLGAMALVNDASVVRVKRGHWAVQGDPTEGALWVASAKAGLRKHELDKQFPRCNEIPFTSESKCMTTLHVDPDGGLLALTKGALESLLPFCTHWLTSTGESPLTKEVEIQFLAEAEAMAATALRVLAVAGKTNATMETAREGLCLLGLVGMIDPPRPESKAAIELCKKAGIRVVMMTGDHPLTARAVARELELLRHGIVVTGADLDGLSEREFQKKVRQVEVYARVSPEHKLRIVTALQKQGHVVAVTGDGVNDAPALKQADIGVAMGVGGTDVSREAAAMMLMDDNFATIVSAVEEGRGIFSNIKKYLMYLLSANIGEIGLMAGAILIGLPIPLSAVQILYVNLATDGLPAIALAVDPLDKHLMRQPPRDPKRGIFTPSVTILMLVGGIWSTVVNLGLFVWALESKRPIEEAMTLSFVTLVIIEFLKAYNFRSDIHSVFHRPFANRWLNWAILWELTLLIAVIYVPWLQSLFHIIPLTWEDWSLTLFVAFTLIPVLEMAKGVIRWSTRRRNRGA